VGRRTIRLAVMIGEKKKTLCTKLNHIKPLTTEMDNPK
jgi:ribosomal protein L21E